MYSMHYRLHGRCLLVWNPYAGIALMPQFDWLLESYLKTASDIVEGDVIEEVTSPFDLNIMDAGFELGRISVQSVKDRLAGQGLEVDHVVILTAFHTKLKRESTKMTSECKLYVVRNKSGTVNALLFLGGSITE